MDKENALQKSQILLLETYVENIKEERNQIKEAKDRSEAEY
jgi:hypothetical protein